MSLPPDDERCTAMDDGCRCLRPRNHNGPHDVPLTPWVDVLRARASRGDLAAARQLMTPSQRAVVDAAFEIVRRNR